MSTLATGKKGAEFSAGQDSLSEASVSLCECPCLCEVLSLCVYDVCVFVCPSLSVCLCVYACPCVCLCVHAHVCSSACLCMCMSLCVPVSVCMHLHKIKAFFFLSDNKKLKTRWRGLSWMCPLFHKHTHTHINTTQTHIYAQTHAQKQYLRKQNF